MLLQCFFSLTMNQMTMCKMKRIVRGDEPTEEYRQTLQLCGAF